MTATAIGGSLDTVEIHYGFGRHTYYLTLHELKYFAAYAYGEWIQTFFTLMCTKVSLCFFLLRIPITRRYILPLKASIAVLILSNVVITFIWIFQCKPVEGFWDPDIEATCLSHQAIYNLILSQAIVSVLSDFGLALYPVLMLWNIKMNLPNKIGVCIIMGLGVIVGTCCIVRTVLNEEAVPHDATYGGIANWFWRLFEVQGGICCACIPALVPMLKAGKTRYQTFTQTRRSRRTAYYGESNASGSMGWFKKYGKGSEATGDKSAARDPSASGTGGGRRKFSIGRRKYSENAPAAPPKGLGGKRGLDGETIGGGAFEGGDGFGDRNGLLGNKSSSKWGKLERALMGKDAKLLMSTNQMTQMTHMDRDRDLEAQRDGSLEGLSESSREKVAEKSGDSDSTRNEPTVMTAPVPAQHPSRPSSPTQRFGNPFSNTAPPPRPSRTSSLPLGSSARPSGNPHVANRHIIHEHDNGDENAMLTEPPSPQLPPEPRPTRREELEQATAENGVGDIMLPMQGTVVLRDSTGIQQPPPPPVPTPPGSTHLNVFGHRVMSENTVHQMDRTRAEATRRSSESFERRGGLRTPTADRSQSVEPRSTTARIPRYQTLGLTWADYGDGQPARHPP
ncbi:MAG: hypothetical protein M1831_001636 [Alyxoria varia]|nr:MAG: hypothetical protein M1831_001636 [Alyxoria varia]